MTNILPKALRKHISSRDLKKKVEVDISYDPDDYIIGKPRVLSIYFPDHQNKLLHYSFDESTRILDLERDILEHTSSPVNPDMHAVYSLCIPSNESREMKRIPTASEQVIWGYFLVCKEMEYRMLPTEAVEKMNLPDLYLRVHSTIHKSLFLMKVDMNSTGKQVFDLLCEEFEIPKEQQPGFGIFFDGFQINTNRPLVENGIKQMADIDFKHQNKFILKPMDLTSKITIPLQLPGESKVDEAIGLILSWLGRMDSPYQFGLLWKSPLLSLESDLPIMPWLPHESSLADWNFKPDSDIIFSAKPGEDIDFEPLSLVFLSTPEPDNSSNHAPLNPSVKSQRVILLSGEEYLATYRNVYEISKSTVSKNQQKTLGTLYLTNYRLILNAFENEKEGGSYLLNVVINLPLGQIARVIVQSRDYIDIYCKNQRVIGFQSDQAALIAQTIELTAFKPVNESFAFLYDELFPTETDGWKVYDFRSEMTRQGVPNNYWRICTDNEEYDPSPTYPKQYAIPASLSKESLQAVYPYRSKGRIPVLTYLHTNGASITRCSQPQVGLKSKSSNEDKELVNKIRKSAGTSSVLWMLDARPKASAVANRVMDGGYETNYKNCKIKFCNIENIHVMRHSVRDLIQACNEYATPYFSGVAQSKWLDHLFCILSAAHKAAKLILNGSSVMVHCSDGWDRTPQICALAQILLDPYFRTIEGFEVLIEKDFCSFGHKFGQRLGHCSGDHSDSERSPVFSQFLDCVWQIKEQFPNEFEFTDGFLQTVLHHSTSCRFGTFLYDNDCERKGHQVQRQTISLWTFINNNLHAFKNPLYNPSGEAYIKPFISDRSLEIWKSVYCFQSDYDSQYQYNKLFSEAKMAQLYQENQLLTARLRHLEALVAQTQNTAPPVPPRKPRRLSFLSSSSVRQTTTCKSPLAIKNENS